MVSKLVSKPKVPPPVVSPAPVTASTPVVSEDKTVQQRKAAEVPVVAADVETVADLPSAATGKPVEENQLPKIEVTAEKPIDKSPEPVAEAAVIRKKSQAKARPVKKRVAKKNIAKKPPAPKKRPVKKAIKKSVPKSVAGKSVEPGKPKATTSGKSKPALRKGARRGIRLKLGDRNGME